MPAKNNPPPSAVEHIAAAEVEHIAVTAAAAQEHDELRNEADALDLSIEEAEESLDDVIGSLRAGEDGVTGATKREAEDHLDALRERREGLSRRLDRLAKLAKANVQVDAAYALVPVLRKVLPGVPVVATCGPVPKEVADSEVPLVVVRQYESATTADGHNRRVWSSLSGIQKAGGVHVEVSLYRGIIHRELDADRLRAVVRALDARVQVEHVSPRAVTDSLSVDVARIEVFDAAPVPAVLAYQPGERSAAAESLASQVGGKVARAARMKYESSRVQTITTTEEDGQRRTSVVGVTTVKAPGSEDGARTHYLSHASERPTAPSERPSDLVGAMVGGLSRITQVESNPATGTWSVSLVSRVSYDTRHPAIGGQAEAA